MRISYQSDNTAKKKEKAEDNTTDSRYRYKWNRAIEMEFIQG